MIPDYIDCNNQKILHCEYLMLKECPNTCAYSKYIMGTVVREFRDGKLIERVEELD